MKYSNKKEEILNAVKELFSQKGYMLSMSDIALQEQLKFHLYTVIFLVKTR